MDIEQDSEASLGEFMKLSLEGFSWAENICQRVENICTENNMVQNPGKYVNAVGEHFKKVIDTVVNDLYDHADDVLELFSELTLGHASPVKASVKMGEELDGDLLHEKFCKEETAFMETSPLDHDSVPEVLENLGPVSVKSTSDGTVFTRSKLDEAFSSTMGSLIEDGDGTVIHERSRIEIEASFSLEKYACATFEQEVHSVEKLSRVILPSEPQFYKIDVSTGILVETRVFDVEGLSCTAGNFCNVAAFDTNLTRSQSIIEANSSMTQETTTAATSPENLSIISKEGFGNSSIFSLKNEDLNEFEDVKLEDDFEAVKVENDDWDDMVKTEIALISSLVARKESSKKKLKKMLTSRWRPSRSRELVTHQSNPVSQTSLDSDWELL